MENANVRVVETWWAEVDPVAVSGGGLFTDRRKVVRVTVWGMDDTELHYNGDKLAMVEEVTFTTVPVIIVGIVLEAINTSASINAVVGAKKFTNYLVTHFKTVAADLEPIPMALF